MANASNLDRIVVKTGTQTYTSSLSSYGPGEALLRISAPFSSGDQQSVQLFGSDGNQVANLVGIPIEEQPAKYNFNYWSGMTAFWAMELLSSWIA